ncbi:OmpH family outer membrane protein [Jannaschia rubra]|uniref:OmpH family outer membrane protein n=1 Tax=Jannaschia rubra TaxID=282197 RepID=UPI00248F4A84|nr:OmpH family outer membrane protein [Jannaschia rubra]
MRLRPAIAALFICAGPVAAQETGEGLGVPQSAVVVLDRDALFATSLFGQRVTRDIEAETSALAAENRRIEAELEAEERELTQRRKTMEPGEFRELAAEFDTRVNGIREAQDAKARAIAQQGERAQQLFFDRANPVLVDLARETGALVILDRRIVIASADQVDITALAQSRIDAALGEGVATDGTQPRPRPTPPEAETGTD